MSLQIKVLNKYLGYKEALLPKTAKLITQLFPVSAWYRMAWLLVYKLPCFLHGDFTCKHRPDLNHARRLNKMLAIYTRAGKPFHIPVKKIGFELLQAHPLGLVLASVHLPLIKVTLREIIAEGFSLDAAIARQPTRDGHIAVWGNNTRIPALKTDAQVLLKAKRVLERGGSVVALIDYDLGSIYSPNLFQLAGRTGSRLIFFFAWVESTGVITVSLVKPPAQFNQNELALQQNMVAMRQYEHSILDIYQGLSQQEPSKSMVLAPFSQIIS